MSFPQNVASLVASISVPQKVVICSQICLHPCYPAGDYNEHPLPTCTTQNTLTDYDPSTSLVVVDLVHVHTQAYPSLPVSFSTEGTWE